ncbi:hypothetical protein QR685DRAFT_516973 [Neurospora intermedia]|uniref:Uncharacterized protein n=1 Tax=Neurospora intermedia TaxID=5142 RepID=A0ABR3DLF5_NEUIN
MWMAVSPEHPTAQFPSPVPVHRSPRLGSTPPRSLLDCTKMEIGSMPLRCRTQYHYRPQSPSSPSFYRRYDPICSAEHRHHYQTSPIPVVNQKQQPRRLLYH